LIFFRLWSTYIYFRIHVKPNMQCLKD
jgi:hypothetical protein